MAQARSKRKASSPLESKCPAAAKFTKTSGVKPESHFGKEKKELDPDRSNKTSKEETLNQKELQQEIRKKKKEIKELNKEKEDAHKKMQQQANENKKLTARIEELEKEVERLNAEIKKLEKELEKIKGNEHYIRLAAMCDKLQKNFYQIVFYPHYDFSEYEQSYQARYLEDDIDDGDNYGLKTGKKKREAKKRWSDLKKDLGWKFERHVRGIKQLKYDRNRTAHPKITKGMKKKLEDGAKALNNERKLDKRTFRIVKDLIEMWFITEDLVQKQEKKKKKERRA